jgi:hypothetical protein
MEPKKEMDLLMRLAAAPSTTGDSAFGQANYY